MDNYIVSARKYRPSTFRSVVGQHALTTTLRNAIAGNKLAHAYLFSGPRGVGKTTCARIFAKTINCLNPTAEHEACNACESCVAFNEQRSYNIHELDAASNNGVEDIRLLIDQVRIPPQIGRYKVYIIDEVHMLSASAFNSFLKTLEEPPAHAIFILATTEKHKIIPTILSRCQVYDFNRISIGDIVDHLQHVATQENVSAEAEALNIIAQKADGGMRDALSIFDQTVSYTGGKITYKSVIENLNVLDYEYYFNLTEAILEGNVSDALLILNDILNRGFEGQYIISGIASHFRDLLVSRDPVTAELFQVGASIRDRYTGMAKRCNNAFLYEAIAIANDCDLNYRISKNKRLMLELMLIKLCQLNEKGTLAKDEKKKSLKPIETGLKSSNNQEETKATSKPVNESTEHITTAEKQQEAIEHTSQRSEVADSEGESYAPAPPPGKSSTQKKKYTSVYGMGVSLSSLSENKVNEPESTGEVKEVSGSRQFSEEELLAAWKEFAEQLTEEKLLKNTMTLYLPRLIGEELFEVEVNTELNSQYLNDYSYSILSFLREKLDNGEITMSIRIAEGNAIRKALTSREIFEEMTKQNSSLQKLSDEFGLELS